MLALLLFLLSCGASSLTADEIHWRSDPETAFAEAAELNRPLLIEFTRENCGWCRSQERYVHADPLVIELLNSQFIPLRQTGGPLSTRYKSTGTPHIVAVTPDGEQVLARISGYVGPRRYRTIMQQIPARGRMFKAAPQAFDAYLEADHLYSKKLAFAEAQARLDEVMPALKEHALPHVLCAWTMVFMDHRTAAMEEYNLAIAADADCALAYFGRGVLHYDDDEIEAANNDLRHALQLDPANQPDAAVYLALAFNRAGKHERSREFLTAYREAYRPERIATTDFVWAHIDYLLDLVTEENTLLNGCRSSTFRPWFLAEIHFVIAARAAIDGRTSDVETHLAASLEKKQAFTFYRQSAAVLLNKRNPAEPK